MKKNLITAGIIAGVIILGFGVVQSNADSVDPKLSSKTVKEQIGVAYPGVITEFELEEENGRAVYEIEVEGDGVEYDLKVDGDTGQVIKEAEKNERKQVAVEQTSTVDVKQSENNIEEENLITLEEAKKIALEKFNGTIKDVEYEKDDGRFKYEIEIKNGREEAEFKIDAATGEIIEFEIDRD